MASIHPDLESAIAEIVERVSDQTPEFRRRLKRLIVNTTNGEVPDGDIRDVIELAVMSTILDE